jgi:hypothetical protein
MWFDQKPKWKKRYNFHCQTGSDDDDDKKDKEVSKKEREKDQSAWDMESSERRDACVCVKVSEEHFSCLVF